MLPPWLEAMAIGGNHEMGTSNKSDRSVCLGLLVALCGDAMITITYKRKRWCGRKQTRLDGMPYVTVTGHIEQGIPSNYLIGKYKPNYPMPAIPLRAPIGRYWVLIGHKYTLTVYRWFHNNGNHG